MKQAMTILSGIFFGLNLLARPIIYFESAILSRAYQNQVDSAVILVFEKNTKRAKVVNLHSQESHEIIVDDACRGAKFEFAFPYLISLDVTCEITGDRLKFLHRENRLNGSFAHSFLGEDSQAAYFVTNGRVFPTAKRGYVAIKRVDKHTKEQRTSIVLDQVPGFSGGMRPSSDGTELFYTMASGSKQNLLFSLPIDDLIQLFEKKRIENFMEVATKLGTPFAGLSFSLFVNGQDLLYCNTNEWGVYQSYLLLGNERTQRSIDFEGCTPLGSFEGMWLQQCGSQIVGMSSDMGEGEATSPGTGA